MKMTPEQFAELKRGYKMAVESKEDTFLFYGNEMLTSYTKYLIESLEPKMEGKK